MPLDAEGRTTAVLTVVDLDRVDTRQLDLCRVVPRRVVGPVLDDLLAIDQHGAHRLATDVQIADRPLVDLRSKWIDRRA